MTRVGDGGQRWSGRALRRNPRHRRSLQSSPPSPQRKRGASNAGGLPRQRSSGLAESTVSLRVVRTRENKLRRGGGRCETATWTIQRRSQRGRRRSRDGAWRVGDLCRPLVGRGGTGRQRTATGKRGDITSGASSCSAACTEAVDRCVRVVKTVARNARLFPPLRDQSDIPQLMISVSSRYTHRRVPTKVIYGGR